MELKEMDDLLIRYLAGETSSEENQSIANWLKTSDKNRQYFNSYRDLWLVSVQHATPKRSLPKPESKEFKLIAFSDVLKVASIILLFFVSGILGYQYYRTEKKLASLAKSVVTFESRKGTLSMAVMPDGSKVWLNAGSKITYNQQYNLSQRTVNLTGEAYFDVVTNPAKPFIVKAGKLKIKALGTLFNVKAYPEDHSIVTTLERGKIIIEGKDQHNKEFTVDVKPKQTIVYYPDHNEFLATQKQNSTSNESPVITPEGEKTSLNNLSIVKMNEVNTELYTSWKGEKWVIEKQSLDNLTEQLERRYNISIQFSNDNLKKYRFSGTIQNETIEQIMDIMRNTMPLTFTMEKGKILIQEDKKRLKEFNR